MVARFIQHIATRGSLVAKLRYTYPPSHLEKKITGLYRQPQSLTICMTGLFISALLKVYW